MHTLGTVGWVCMLHKPNCSVLLLMPLVDVKKAGPGACVVRGGGWRRGLHVGVAKDGWWRHSGMQLGLHEEGGGSGAHCASG